MLKKIFISYSHDSDGHRALVRSIADQLRADGLDCQIDQYVNGFPPEGWQRWMETQIEEADYVLIICTQLYLKRFRGRDTEGGRGVNFEGVVISQELYDDYYRNDKFIPVITDFGSVDDVPRPLKAYSTYHLPTKYTELYRVLTDQAATPAPVIGKILYLPPKSAGGIALNIDLEHEKIEAASYTDLPAEAVRAKLDALEEELKTQKRTNYDLSDLISSYRDKVKQWEEKYHEAINQNTKDLEKEPDNPLLIAEKAALEVGDFELTAELRERYYRQLKQAQLNKIETMKKELALEAFIAGERWESANGLARALPLFQEAAELLPAYPEAWRKITLTAKRLGNNSLALEACRSLQKLLEPKGDSLWFSVALNDEGDILKSLGQNILAFDKYSQVLKLRLQAVEAEPQNAEWQRDLSVSHNKVADMHKANGDNVSALKAYQDSLVIAQNLAELDPNIVEWQTDLVVSYFKLSQLQTENAKTLLGDALAILKRLHGENRLDHEKQSWIKILKGMI
jgi:hypothetical protein